jgi:hypothetical protein
VAQLPEKGRDGDFGDQNDLNMASDSTEERQRSRQDAVVAIQRA